MKAVHFVFGEFFCFAGAVLNSLHVSFELHVEVIILTLSFLSRQLSWENIIYVFSLYPVPWGVCVCVSDLPGD